jgi:SAM-dependent methyltransferase
MSEITNDTLAAHAPWLHDFDLPAPLRVPMDETLRTRIGQRKSLILPRIAAQFPNGRLDGLRVLDLGANAGFWAREMSALGARVTCVESKRHNIAQAELIARIIGDADLTWVESSAEEFLARGERFDVVLCLGLLYHAADAFGLLRACAAACADLLVVDSHCINDDAAYVEFRHEYTELPSQGISSMVTVPSRGAMYRMMKSTGFAHLMEAANVGNVPEDYRSFTRSLMLARRSAPLAAMSELGILDVSTAGRTGRPVPQRRAAAR